MSIFNKYKLLHGLPVEGQKIKFTRPTKLHWFTSVVEDEKKLEIGEEYTVQYVELNSSATYVWLKEFFPNEDRQDNPIFNMSAFEWEKPEINLDNLVGYDILDMGTLHRCYGCGIEVDGKLQKNMEGSPVIVFEYDVRAWAETRLWTITKAYWKNE